MTDLATLLTRCASAYADLADAAVGLQSADGGDGMPKGGRDPLDRPAPGDLHAIDHRHLLVRGLRWWVDAVRDPAEHTKVGHSVPLMARWLLDHVDVMAAEDQAELGANLDSWLRKAWPYLGDTDDRVATERLPEGAHDQLVRVADAAQLLGCTVRTIQRRVPAERRAGGMVRLGDAMPACSSCGQPEGLCEHTRCPSCDLIVGQCTHTHGVRNGTLLFAQ